MSRQTSVGYKKKLIAASELRTQGRAALFQRATLLVEVFEDREFRADNDQFDDLKAAELLDSYLEDTAATFLEVRAILQTFPTLEQWKGKTIRELYESALESSRASSEEKTRATPRRITIKQFEGEQQARKEAEAEVRNLKKQITELEASNRKYIRENAQLEGRITELERIARRELISG